MKPEPRWKWDRKPGEQARASTVEYLCGFLSVIEGRPGVTVQIGKVSRHGLPTVNVVYRGENGQPVGILQLQMLDGSPEIVNIAVDPDHRRQGIARKLCDRAYREGFDLRDCGAVWDGPLTDEGKALRDGLVAWGKDRYGPASWEQVSFVG